MFSEALVEYLLPPQLRMNKGGPLLNPRNSQLLFPSAGSTRVDVTTETSAGRGAKAGHCIATMPVPVSQENILCNGIAYVWHIEHVTTLICLYPTDTPYPIKWFWLPLVWLWLTVKWSNRNSVLNIAGYKVSHMYQYPGFTISHMHALTPLNLTLPPTEPGN